MYNKYRNRKTTIDGIVFDSKKEAKRYLELKLMVRVGLIRALTTQPRYLLQDSFVDFSGKKHRKIEYVSDFRYLDIEKNLIVVEDVKGKLTDVYKIKKKLFLKRYPFINFIES